MDGRSIGLCLFSDILGILGVITLNSVFILVAILASISTIIYNVERIIKDTKREMDKEDEQREIASKKQPNAGKKGKLPPNPKG